MKSLAKNKNISILLLIFPTIFFLSGCATYYQRTKKLQDYIKSGQYQKADEMLSKDVKAPKKKDKLLYYMNRGWISWIMNEPEKSNVFFQEADHIIEDYQKNIGLQALSLISNPMVLPYKPEDFETVLVNYFKALNYLSLNKTSEALVECKRINIRLHELNDKYKDNKNRYQDDAFAHIIMGMIYEADNDYNNAFIAYRNALEVFESSYVSNFNIEIPRQLKLDILRTADLSGFYSEVDYYEKKFNMNYQRTSREGGELVFFWHNGFGPVKSEWSINFTKVDGKEGWITFVNDEYGLNFPFYVGNKSKDEQNAIADISLLRVAFPKYLERKPVFESAQIKAYGKDYELEKAQDINAIAFKTLNDRMLREMANSLLRLATKKAMELAAKKNDKNELGTTISIINAITEKADTRNWQTLPYEIQYARIPLPAGTHTVTFSSRNNAGTESRDIEVDITKGRLTFFTFSNTESMPLQKRVN